MTVGYARQNALAKHAASNVAFAAIAQAQWVRISVVPGVVTIVHSC